MLLEVSNEWHPEHIPGGGPEQDYLSRFFLSAPWRHIHVTYNFQPHHVPFALERSLMYRNSWVGHAECTPEVMSWAHYRVTVPPEEVHNVHFSGAAKLWDRHVPCETGVEDADFAEKLLRENLEGYTRWVQREAPQEEYADNGCFLTPSGDVVLLNDKSVSVRPLVDMAVTQVRRILQMAAREWRLCYERLLAEKPGLRKVLLEPEPPKWSQWGFNAEVEALLWGTWHPSRIKGFHHDGSYLVCMDVYGRKTVERRVCKDRLR